MIVKKINHNELGAAIRVAFAGDMDIFKYYDPTVFIESLDDIVEDILRKEKSYEEVEGEMHYYGFYEKGKLIGYFFYKDKLLISFGLNIQYRNRQYLRQFFSSIAKKIGKNFICHLWSKNLRAIGFLVKMGMEIIDEFIYLDNLVTKLVY